MNNPGQELQGVGDADHIEHWLDGCYKRWFRVYRRPLIPIIVVSWLPVLVSVLMAERGNWSAPAWAGRNISWILWIYMLAPFVNIVLAIMVAGAAAVSYKYEPEIRLTSSLQHMHTQLRNKVRRATYRWVNLLLLLQVLVLALLAYPGQAVFVIMIATGAVTLIVAELIQYFALHFPHKSATWRITAVVICVLGYAAIIWIRQGFGNLRNIGLLQDVIEFFMLFAGIPVGAMLLVMLETRYPSKGMLEQL